MLTELDRLPEGLLECHATELHKLLGGPTLIHLGAKYKSPLFVSVLMHGNETTGWEAVKCLLKDHYNARTQRPLSLFIANTEAAGFGVRHLPEQPDYNRVWPGSELEHTPEHAMMQKVVEIMRERGVFASVDIHNNTGLNPHYACVNTLESQTLKLATLFSRTVVYFVRPVGVQSIAMSHLCPAVTLECGKAEYALGTEHALAYLSACLDLNELSTTPVAPHDIDLFHTTATVKIPTDVSFGFNNDELDLALCATLERFNFRELSPGTLFGHSSIGARPVLEVCDESGKDVFNEYFTLESNQVKTQKHVMPSMLTSNVEVIRQDCLCYLMERYTLP